MARARAKEETSMQVTRAKTKMAIAARNVSLLLLAALVACAVVPAALTAAVVTNCNSSGTGSLAAAVSGGGLVTFSLSCTGANAIPTSLTLSSDVTIDASGYSVALDGGGNSGVLLVSVGVTAALNDLTIQNGNINLGGAIRNVGNLIVTNTTFLNNSGTLAGGAIENLTTAVIINCTFSNNSSAAGGAIDNTGTLSLTNSTFSNNRASNAGAAIKNSGTAQIQNTIFAGSTGGNCAGGVTDGGYNLADDATCGFTATGSQNSVTAGNVNLGSPFNNGGATKTLALGSGSIAIGVIPAGTNGCATTVTKDQRGVERPGDLNGNCSIGAYESVSPVTTTITDCSDDTQLRSAMNTGGRIVFACSGDIVVTQILPILSNTALDATGQIVTLDGGGSTQVLEMGEFSTNTAPFTLTLNNVNIENGNSVSSNLSGAAIFNGTGIVIVANSLLSNNKAAGFQGGGAIYNGFGTVIIANSTLAHNSSDGDGGAIWNTAGVVNITNSTISNNSSADTGGAIWNDNTLTITNSTFSNNSAQFYGDAIYNATAFGLAGTTSLENTIIAGSGSGGSGCLNEATGVFVDLGYNLDDDGSCGFSAVNHSFSNNANANLGSLSYNGGPTLTIPLSNGSTALGAIPFGSNGCGANIVTDERGVFRPQGFSCDIGALQTTVNQMQIAFNTNPANLAYMIGPSSYAGAQILLTLPINTQSTIWAPSPQPFAAGAEYTFASWSDSGAEAHAIAISPALTSETATFIPSYLLTTAVNLTGAGTVSVTSSAAASNGYYPAGTQVTLTAHTNAGFLFSNWTGTTSSSSNPLVFTMNSPVSETANFLHLTSTTVALSVDPAVFDQPVTITATVSNGTTTPPSGGNVTFKAGTVTLGVATLSNGTASYTTTPGQLQAVQQYQITASFAGNSQNNGSTSGPVNLLVNPATTTTVLVSSINPAALHQLVTLKATVVPQFQGIPTGTVTFYNGSNVLQTVSLVNGVATYSSTTLAAGVHNIKATYNGSAGFKTSSATLMENIN
jgi:Bacterial Ig-like domain (group 3)/Divergent InlB B-repeat domain